MTYGYYREIDDALMKINENLGLAEAQSYESSLAVLSLFRRNTVSETACRILVNDLHEYIEQLIEHDIERMHVSIVAVLFAVIEYRSSISDKDSLAVSEMIEEIIGSIAEFSTRVREKYE